MAIYTLYLAIYQERRAPRTTQNPEQQRQQAKEALNLNSKWK